MSRVKTILFCLWCILLLSIIGCSVAKFYPEDGEWYCEELQMQLSFDGLGDCYYLVGEERISCACGSDKGSSWLSVGCQEADSEYFDLGEEVFGAEFVRRDKRSFVVYDETAEKEYVFYRVE